MSKRLAIVDDQLVVITSLASYFELFVPGLEVESFCGGQEILQAISKGNRYDAVLMDGKLSDGYKGPAYTAEIIRLCPTTIVIGFSSDERLKGEFIRKGAKLFLSKVSSMEELTEVIKSALGL